MTELAHHHRKGIFALIAATFFFAGMDMAMKLLSDHYPSLQVVFIRAVSSLPILLLVAPFMGGYRQLRTQRLPVHIMRGCLGLLMLTLVVYSFNRLSLANAYAIFFAGPLFITILSIPILGEQVGRHRWAAVIIGFCGVLVIANPQGSGLVSLGALAALAAALFYALLAITMRTLSASDSALTISFYFLVMLTIGAGGLSIFNWQPIHWNQWPLFILLGISGMAGMMALATAFRSAQASAIAPFEYTALLWALLLDYFVWGDIPHARLYTGAAIIVLSGIYIVHREHRASLALRQHAYSATPSRENDANPSADSAKGE